MTMQILVRIGYSSRIMFPGGRVLGFHRRSHSSPVLVFHTAHAVAVETVEIWSIALSNLQIKWVPAEAAEENWYACYAILGPSLKGKEYLLIATAEAWLIESFERMHLKLLIQHEFAYTHVERDSPGRAVIWLIVLSPGEYPLANSVDICCEDVVAPWSGVSTA